MLYRSALQAQLCALTIGLALGTSVFAATPVGRIECSSIRPSVRSSQQLIVVLTKNWKSVNATIFAYERNFYGQWVPIAENIDGRVGTNGLGWGQGIQRVSGDTDVNFRKSAFRFEGDNKAPAGVFTLGPTFGIYPSIRTEEQKKGNTFIPVQDGLNCPDDYRSPGYNQFVTLAGEPRIPGLKVLTPSQIIDSENMIEMVDPQNPHYGYKGWLPYQLGVFVNNNTGAVKADPATHTPYGSCIFLHVMQPDGKGTAGCTSMRLVDLKQLVKWRDDKKHPLLIQLPVDQWNDIRNRCGDLP